MNHLRAFPLGLSGEPSLRPDQALQRLAGARRPFLLDGAADADGLGRWSYAGCEPRAHFRLDAVPERSLQPPAAEPVRPHLFVPGAGGSAVAPAAAVYRQLAQVVDGWAPWVAVGLIDYEIGRASERLPQRAAAHGLGTAALDFAAYDAVYRYDAATGHADLLATDADAANRLRARLARPTPPASPLHCGPLRSETSASEYGRRVERVREHLRAGDCYQVNLCRRLRAAMPRPSALPAYLQLRRVAPAPLGFYLDLDETGQAAGAILLSNTPELLLRLDWPSRLAETRPIKGTRPRGATPQEDRALRDELVASAKDRAEHIMIVDLLRNDLGRTAEVGSVAVSGLLRPVELPTVHHLVSTISARPAAGIGLAELLHALLPGGSITGAPKVAAMALIDELEPHRRGPFYGAVGWLGPTGGELALCIRTAVATGDELVLAVGGGIVLDSDPDEEWRETEAKAAAFQRALS